ncbi:hypothetical protein B0T21DRAFT_432990 [Apiosordaria backusii]|uniref:Uncharacterized protein n=1 Tax=Apiosordaria backusii TaxID=314023 RepID=A0AA40ELU4_9PEZI|nr:hypothetical protein B0T21DRAFT_432990 [Apiosordaria backusii]
MSRPAKFTNRWEDIKDDLFEIIYHIHAPLSAEQKDAVVKEMRSRGFNIGWNGIRYRPTVDFLLLLSFPSDYLYFPSHLSRSLFSSVRPSTLDAATTFRPHTITMSSRAPRAPRTLQKWDSETHTDILLAVCQHMKPTKVDWQSITEILQVKGYTFTSGALRYAFIRLVVRLVVGSQARKCGTLLRGHQVKTSASASASALASASAAQSPAIYCLVVEISPNPSLKLCPNDSHFPPTTTTLVTTNTHTWNTSHHITMGPGRVSYGKPATIWDEEAHLTLLQAIIACGIVKAADWDAIIDYVSRRGYNYTAGAAIKTANMADKTRMKWDLQANHDLLYCIVQELSPSQDQLRGVMGRMHEAGYTCTLKAITQHLQKLRRKENATANDGGESSGAGPAVTPGPKRGKAAPKKTPGSKRKAIDNDSDDEEPEHTPTKKRRAVKKEVIPKSEPRVKDEEDDDEDHYSGPQAATSVPLSSSV